ncbi:MAG: hypothetical protein AAEA78_02670 [Methylophilaceae bacterium]
MYEIFDLYLIEFIVGALVLSIAIVVISILHVIFQTDELENSKTINSISFKSDSKIKYSKEFLKRVKGIDLDLIDK